MTDQTCRRPVRWDSAAKTDKGTVRPNNEDAYSEQASLGFWAVADGMGGHAVGDLASAMIVDALEQIQNLQSVGDMVDEVEDALLKANNDIYGYANRTLDQSTMGSTAVSLLIRGQVGVGLWVGDSRLYQFRGSELKQLTCDHSQVQEWIQQGVLTPEQALNHSRSNVITRAIGVGEEVDIDICLFDAQVGDTFLLCSDGLYESLAQKDIEAKLRYPRPQQCVDELIDLALDNQASDNISAIVVKGGLGDCR
ncbi:MAG: protein phosphatase 2C domain-containing protein [Pseudomonadota bacterium]